MPNEKLFPLQASSKPTKPGPRQIPWSVAEMAYGAYSARYGTDQSLERLAERGGFGWNEMDLFHPTWREEVSEIHQLRKQVADLTTRDEMSRQALTSIKVIADGSIDASFIREHVNGTLLNLTWTFEDHSRFIRDSDDLLQTGDDYRRLAQGIIDVYGRLMGQCVRGPLSNWDGDEVDLTGLKELRDRAELVVAGKPDPSPVEKRMQAELDRARKIITDYEIATEKAVALERAASQPVPMVLHCPACNTQHIDKPEPERGWDNPPHKSHLCHGCGIVWRPADVPTVGVESVTSRGNKDTWPPPEESDDVGRNTKAVREGEAPQETGSQPPT